MFEIIISVILFILSFFFLKKTKKEFNSFDTYKEEQKIKEEIKKKNIEEKIKDLNKFFIIIVFLFLVSCSNTRTIVVPEPPEPPKLTFIKCNNMACIEEKDVNKLLYFLEMQKIYKEKLIKTLKEIK